MSCFFKVLVSKATCTAATPRTRCGAGKRNRADGCLAPARTLMRLCPRRLRRSRTGGGALGACWSFQRDGGLRCISKYFYRAVLLYGGGKGTSNESHPKSRKKYIIVETKENPAAILLSAPLRISVRGRPGRWMF